ncbi:tripartite tricarboxylate transporter TctB family protein [Solicola gregarius]|uniref:Tripartite tricarboxylate transporter TctB family protein n=1 Tax=Solicola gregarius TaxID=2908642 RepID=A0AA46TEZ0_9ACTN|nr:tripartite tricarboxylate transporter TctB family protein [Solicola gregarius]UYM03323.1 tripartite tricarboxylate transporter TctB family protein [Solicola gregarius]
MSTEPSLAAQPTAAISNTTRALLTGLRSALPEVVALIACVVLYLQTLDFRGTDDGPGPALYPRLLIALLAFVMALRIIGQVRSALRHGGDVSVAAVRPPAEEDTGSLPLRRIAQVIAIAVGFVVATVYLGWLLATFLFIPLFCWACGKRNLLVTVPLGAVLAVGSSYLFIKLVYIALPTGIGAFDEFSVQAFLALGIY